jgi:hypothetical protein
MDQRAQSGWDLEWWVISPKIVSPITIRIMLVSATLLFLATEGVVLLIFVRGHNPLFIYNLLFYCAPLTTLLPWLGGLMTYTRTKRALTMSSTDSAVAAAVLYMIAGFILLSYCALLVIVLLLAGFIVH